jgi:hypothetical protein
MHVFDGGLDHSDEFECIGIHGKKIPGEAVMKRDTRSLRRMYRGSGKRMGRALPKEHPPKESVLLDELVIARCNHVQDDQANKRDGQGAVYSPRRKGCET